jgi:uncharacterized protein YukE
MSRFLSEQLDFFGKQAHSEAWAAEHDDAMLCRDVEDAVAIALQLIDRIDRLTGYTSGEIPDWSAEQTKQFAPWYTRWHEHAREIVGAIKRLRRQGYKIADLDRFMFAYLRSQTLGKEYEQIRADMKAVAAGHSTGIPLQQILDELQRDA